MTASLSDVADKTFDYVVVGGGTAGSVIAARLSEDPSVSVAVLEAGEAHVDDPNIMIPAAYGNTFFQDKYDWQFPVVKQKFCNDREFRWNRGKGLGGSTCLNFCCWSKPPATDWNVLEELGNHGWNWNDYLKYSLRSETFDIPTEKQMQNFSYTHDPQYHGTSGPIKTSIPHHMYTVDIAAMEAVKKHGAKYIKDPYGGEILGTFFSAANLDSKTWTRSTAATGYLFPNRDRPNLTILTEAVVSRVLFSDRAIEGDLTVVGVEFLYGGQSYVLHVKKEAVLSAGAIKSPQILELSGVGRREVLKRIGVEQNIDLPGVGENVQEHSFCSIPYELKLAINLETADLFRDPEYAAKALALYDKGTGPYRTACVHFTYLPLSTINSTDVHYLYEKAVQAVEKQKKESTHPALAEHLDIQLRVLQDDKIPDIEIITFPAWINNIGAPEPGKPYASMLFAINHPFSRGTIHSRSKDPLEQPECDPHYFENDFDLEILVQQFKFIRKLIDTEPLKSAIAREAGPGVDCHSGSDGNIDDGIRDYIKNAQGTTYHTAGSTSMLPREKWGVVDPELKVYGTTNLRVADLGILPLHISSHTQATAYVIGEKAADIIRSAVIRY